MYPFVTLKTGSSSDYEGEHTYRTCAIKGWRDYSKIMFWTLKKSFLAWNLGGGGQPLIESGLWWRGYGMWYVTWKFAKSILFGHNLDFWTHKNILTLNELLDIRFPCSWLNIYSETVIRMSHDTSILIAIISHNFEFKPWAEQRFGFKTS